MDYYFLGPFFAFLFACCIPALVMSRQLKRGYDFVILGAGSGGVGAAYALALKYPRASIVVVEEGPAVDAPVVSRVPLLQPFLGWFRSMRPFFRDYHTPSQAHLGNRHLRIRRGRGFGGSTLVDDSKCMKGTRSDYDAWTESPAEGAHVWSWEAMTSTFRKIEHYPYGTLKSESTRGEGGLLRVSEPTSALVNADLNVRFVQSCEAAAVPPIADTNEGYLDGVGTVQTYRTGGTRADVFNSLIMSERHRTPLLECVSGVSARRLLIDPARGHCTGVVVRVAGGEEQTVECGVAVVVALGGIESPALLLRSGVGPAPPAAQSSWVLDSPHVGLGMITPVSVDLTFAITQNQSHVNTRNLNFKSLRYMREQWSEYKEEQSGVFSSLGEVQAFVRSSEALPEPDLMLELFNTALLNEGESLPTVHGYTVRVTHLLPASRGSVTIDGTGAAQVDPNALADAADAKALDEGILWAGLLCGPNSTLQSIYHPMPNDDACSPFHRLGPKVVQPAARLVTAADSAKFISERASLVSGSVFGTCAMGRVVDEKLCVKGLSNVCVADASVVPVPVRGNSRTVALNIGLRVADFY